MTISAEHVIACFIDAIVSPCGTTHIRASFELIRESSRPFLDQRDTHSTPYEQFGDERAHQAAANDRRIDVEYAHGNRPFQLFKVLHEVDARMISSLGRSTRKDDTKSTKPRPRLGARFENSRYAP